MVRVEMFEPDRVTDALARFDELTAEPPIPARRVPPNTAISFGTRADGAAAAADVSALGALFAERATIRDHKTGRTFGREERSRGCALCSRGLASRHRGTNRSRC
jgi:hypothetical protein